MTPPRSAGVEATGIEGASSVLCVAAFVNAALGLLLLQRGWLPPVGGHVFFFLGLEFAAGAVVTAAVALTLGPTRRHASARRAWIAGGAGLALFVGALVWILPALYAPEIVAG